MKRLLIALLSTFALGTVQAQAVPWFWCLETSSDAIDLTKNDPNIFKAEVPYKKYVRLVTNIVEVPKEVADQPRDLQVQFFEHLVRNHRSELEKFRRHYANIRSGCGRIYTPNDVPNKLQARQRNSQVEYEIIKIDDFKYIPRKPVNLSSSPEWKEAEQIIVHGK